LLILLATHRGLVIFRESIQILFISIFVVSFRDGAGLTLQRCTRRRQLGRFFWDAGCGSRQEPGKRKSEMEMVLNEYAK